MRSFLICPGAAPSHSQGVTPHWYRFSLCGVLLLAVFLNFFRLGQDGYSNLYYAAAVKSMLSSWQNFFFLSFDPGGFVSIDKPPLGFWLQAASAKLFGYSPFSLLLPQALAGVLSVVLLTHLVRRNFGPVAGLLAGATLALTPISVVTNRNTTPDSLLVMVVLLAAWAVSLAVETGRLRFLLVCFALVGLGFNIKMLQAYLVLPAFVLLYWFAAPLPWKVRLLHLTLATCLLLAVSLCWMLAVDLTPAILRPFVGSSQNNSELQLALTYNGVERFVGIGKGPVDTPSIQVAVHHLPESIFLSYFIGQPGLLRLISPPLGEQIGWLLPLVILGLLGVRWGDKPAIWPLNRPQQGVALWGGWFLSCSLFFSSASILHEYYTALLAPAACALAGIGMITVGQDYRRKWLLPLALAATTLVQFSLLMPYVAEMSWLILLLALIMAMTVGLLLFRQRYVHFQRRALLLLSLVALCVTPALWSTIPVLQDRNLPFPYAGPPLPRTALEKLIDAYDTQLTRPDPELIRYLIDHQGKTRYLVATFDSTTAAPIILATGKPVMAVGGYRGTDQILTRGQLADLIRGGVMRFFLLPKTAETLTLAPELRQYLQELQRIGPEIGYATPVSLITWVHAHCLTVVPATWYRHLPQSSPDSTISSEAIFDLYDCSSLLSNASY